MYYYSNGISFFDRQFSTNNFVLNKATSSGGVVFNSNAYLMITDSIFYNNNGNTYLFYMDATTVTNVSNCYINHLNINRVKYGSVITPGSTAVVPNTQTYLLTHFATFYCPTAEIPINLEVTPFFTMPLPPTPPQSIPLSPTNCINPSDESGNPVRILDNVHGLLEASLLIISF